MTNTKNTMTRKMKTDKLMLVIDGSNLAHRAFQKFETLKSVKGERTGLIYGFMRLLQSYIVRFRPTYVVVTLDSKQSKESNFRNDLLGSYKKHRENISMDYESFNEQLKSVRKMLKYLNIPVVYDKVGLGHESDDYIGFYAKAHDRGKVVIISSDKDFCQLIDERVKIFNPFKEAIINKANCKEIMGYEPSECVDYLCLVGDKSDDIPGYRGIGPVKARKFLDEFKSIENFISSNGSFSGIDMDGMKDLYSRNKVLIDISVALDKYPLKKIPVKYNKAGEINYMKLKDIFKRYTLGSFIQPDFVKPFKTLKPWMRENEKLKLI